ncbi:PilZ domain-containing protein [Paraliomyxa miuraensis]|uniref:PilZ domain-containing protein n=1 Tax=Paraliomyxa miuraensis TaxID=376150 RepID=UPI002257D33A|nr:PilZ domain-containing protein [Paraliomyxa miuraensis]MCX4244579.1 PilZ domain-containing protein [Paraliomyxa miuraensis]
MPVAYERRATARIDKVFRVLLSTDEVGDQWFIARNISATGMFVEMANPLPLRTKVIVRFSPPGGDEAICAMARVQNHYYLQYSDGEGLRALSGVGLRFLRFVAEAGAVPPDDRLH